jgi:hypothetical protein
MKNNDCVLLSNISVNSFQDTEVKILLVGGDGSSTGIISFLNVHTWERAVKVRDKLLHPYKTKCKIRVSYFFIFKFFNIRCEDKDSELNHNKNSLNLIMFNFMNIILICHCHSQVYEICHIFKWFISYQVQVTLWQSICHALSSLWNSWSYFNL